MLVDLEVPTGSIALSGFEKTLENRPLISASDRNMYAKVPAGGAVALRCSRDTAVASGVNSDFPLSILFETLEKNRGPVAQNLSNPSPRQFCRVYHRDSDLKTESSTHFILDSLKPNLELELVADLANQLHDHYSFSFQLMTLKISNSSSGPVSYRIPRLLTHTWIKFILNNGFNYYASYDRPATARTEVTTAGQVNRWQAGDFEFITLDSGSQVEYRFFAEISHVCGSSNEFVGLDFHPPISRDRLLYLERAAAPILPGQESSFLTAYAEYPQAQGALLTEHPKRLNYFVRWSRSSYAPGPMGELPIGDSCWR